MKMLIDSQAFTIQAMSERIQRNETMIHDIRTSQYDRIVAYVDQQASQACCSHQTNDDPIFDHDT